MSGQSERDNSLNDNSDTARHDATRRDLSDKETSQKGSETKSDAIRHSTTDLDIYEHPYVKRLEGQVEKWETKYESQVRRTEEIQIRHQEKLVELQRMTTIGQSKTLADFMLQAKNWIVGDQPEVTPPAEQTQ